jgi:hypothetical protein
MRIHSSSQLPTDATDRRERDPSIRTLPDPSDDQCGLRLEKQEGRVGANLLAMRRRWGCYRVSIGLKDETRMRQRSGRRHARRSWDVESRVA